MPFLKLEHLPEDDAILDNVFLFLRDSLNTKEVMYPRTVLQTAKRIVSGFITYEPPLSTIEETNG